MPKKKETLPAVVGEIEEWRPIKEVEGLYEVSSLGRVRRLTRRAGYFSEPLETPEIITPKKTGYRRSYRFVVLSRDGWKKNFYVHQLVLEAFVGPRPFKKEGSHLDGDASNNRADNLTWETRSKNHLRKWDHDTMVRGERHANSKLTEADVLIIRDSKKSDTYLANQYGVSRSLISQVKRRDIWSHV